MKSPSFKSSSAIWLGLLVAFAKTLMNRNVYPRTEFFGAFLVYLQEALAEG